MSLMDFGMLPPELNSGRIYAGPGSGPLTASAAAWDAVAAELTEALTAYQDTVAELTGSTWQGPSATAMAAAAAPYMTWMSTTAAQAEQTAGQARATAAAYEAARAASVPPPVIAANRTELATLVATNILGQNTPAIAANQAEYAAMWAQDAAAMYGYAGSAAATTNVTPFAAPHQNTDPAADTGQAAATSQATSQATSEVGAKAANAAAATDWLQNILNFNPAETQLGQDFLGINGSFSGIQNLIGGFGYTASGTMFTVVPGVNAGITASTAMTAAMGAATAAPVSSVTAAPGAAGLGATLAGASSSGSAGFSGIGPSAGLGQAGSIGRLSVPASWSASPPAATASSGVRLAAAGLSNAGLSAAPVTGMGGTGGLMGGMPMVAGAVNAPRAGEANSRLLSRMKVLPHEGIDIGTLDGGSDRTQVAPAAGRAGAIFNERDELIERRKAIGELAKERDILRRTAVALLREVTDGRRL